MSTVTQICDIIGRKRLQDELGVGKTAISNAVTDGSFPAKWYAVVQRLCFEVGVPCPLALFNFTAGGGANDQAGGNLADAPPAVTASDAA